MDNPKPWIRQEDGAVYIPDGSRDRKGAIWVGVGFGVGLVALLLSDPRMWIMTLPPLLAGVVYVLPLAWSPIQKPLWLRNDGIYFDDGRVVKWPEVSQAVVMDKGARGQHLFLFGEFNEQLAVFESPVVALRLLRERYDELPVKHCQLGPDPRWYTVISRGVLGIALFLYVAALVPAARLIQGDPNVELLGTMMQMVQGSLALMNAVLLFGGVKSFGLLDRWRMPPVMSARPPRLSLMVVLNRADIEFDMPMVFRLDGERYKKQLRRQKLWMVWFPPGYLAFMVLGYFNNRADSSWNMTEWMIQGSIMYVVFVGAVIACIAYDMNRVRDLVNRAERGDYLELEGSFVTLYENGEVAEKAELVGSGMPSAVSAKAITRHWRSWEFVEPT